MSIFRQLRWKLTFSYTIVTVSAFLVIVLILGGFLFAQIFLPGSYLNPEQLIEGWLNSTVPSTYLLWSQILSQSPVDVELVQRYLNDPQSNITGSDLFRIGALQFSVTTRASIRVLILGTDGTLLGTSAPDDSIFRSALGKRLDPTLVPGLEAPLKAALAGDTDPGRLYTVLKPDEQYVMAAPIFSRASGDESELVGVIEQVTIPVLAIFGERDTQVDPIQGAHVYREALEQAGNSASRVESVPSVNHVIILAETGCMDELAQLVQSGAWTIAPESLDMQEEWLRDLRR